MLAVKRERDEAIAKLNAILTERGLLLKNLTREIADILSDQIEEFEKIMGGDSPLEAAKLRGTLITRILKRICDTFERYREPTSPERLESTFFKATLFELRRKDDKEFLIRQYWHYPTTRTPLTKEIDLSRHSSVCAAHCYREKRIIVLEDIQAEFRKPSPRWEDLRPHQHDDYKSMISVPVMWRERGMDEVHFIGVITIDTNRSGYFRDTEEDREFLNQILAPFLRAVEICYKIFPRQPAIPATSSSADRASAAPPQLAVSLEHDGLAEKG